MIHERHFTLEEAQQLLPQVEPVLRKLHDARARLTDAELHELLSDAAARQRRRRAGARGR